MAAELADGGEQPPLDTLTPPVEADAVSKPCSAAPALGEERKRVLGFTLQLLREFLSHFALEHTREALRRELEASALAEASAAASAELWFDMRQRCRVAWSGKPGGDQARATSTLEQLVAFAVAPPPAARAGGRFALDVGAPTSPLTVVASPKTNAFDGGVSAKAKRSLVLGGANPATFTLMDAIRSAKASASVTFVDSSVTPVEATTQRRLLARKTKRHSRRSPLSPPTYPRSPWGNAALHVNAHFAPSGLARVHGDFDSPVRRGSVASTASSSLLAPEPALVRALDASRQRDLCAVRLVDRELRQLRLERVRSDAAGPTSAAAVEREDAYARALELEKFGSAKRVECALCAFPFLLYNLPHRVSFKCVMDVHDAWGYAPPDRAAAAKYRPPLCYDAVRVCRLCAPIVRQHAAKVSDHGGDASSPPVLGHSRSLEALPATHRRKPQSRGAARLLSPSTGFSSDPYALPPLFADDCMSERDAMGYSKGYAGGYGSGNSSGGPGGAGSMGGGVLESPAKAIVYAHQTDATAFMSAKEWEVINPHRSSIRQVMEESVAREPASYKQEL